MSEYHDYILEDDVQIVREIQDFCADIHEGQVARDEKLGKVDGPAWVMADAIEIADMLMRSKAPVSLFRFIDEKTGNSTYVGYRTRDGREWFHILRQMRNTRGSGLLENLDQGVRS